MTTGRLIRAYLAEARYESLRALRAPSFAIPFLLLPVALYIFFGVYMAGSMSHGDPNAALCMFVNFSVFGVMGPGMFGFGMFVAIEREQGLLTLKRAQPVPAASYVLAKMFMSMLFAVLIMITMIAAGVLLGHVPLSAWQFLAIAAIDIAGALPFCAVGLLVGVWVSGKTAPGIVNLLYLPMMYLGGLFLPMPKAIQPAELFSPAYYLDKLGLIVAGAPSLDQMAQATFNHGSPLLHAAVLAGVTLVLGGLAVRRLARLG